MASVAVGFLAFAASLAAGLAATVLVISFIPPTVPHPTEAYEGVGDALMAQLYLAAGGGVSLLVASVVGMVAGDRAASRWQEP